MSLTSWKKEFYSNIPDNGAGMTAKQAIKHSVKKWTGLLKKNLNKHQMYQEEGVIYDGDSNTFYIDDSSCALCEKYITYIEARMGQPNTVCRKCPLYKSLGKECAVGASAPYNKWLSNGNATAMLKALQKLLEKPNKK